MPDYTKGKIYKIECYTTGLVYIGSTIQSLIQRLQSHRWDYNRYLNGKFRFITSFKILENDNYNIVLLEEYPCENKEQLHAKEAEYIRNNECVNKCIPNRSQKEYYNDNKDQISEQRKQYYNDNKEHYKQYYNDNKEHYKQYYNDNKGQIIERVKQYQQQNKDKIKERKRLYYLKCKLNNQIKNL
jgi:gas vesicle protein